MKELPPIETMDQLAALLNAGEIKSVLLFGIRHDGLLQEVTVNAQEGARLHFYAALEDWVERNLEFVVSDAKDYKKRKS
jgi:hypothetical protein